MSNPNDPAYPIHVPADPGWRNSVDVTHCGMTIRQQFVLAAMQGLCAKPTAPFSNLQTGTALLGAIACAIADAALAEEARTRSKA